MNWYFRPRRNLPPAQFKRLPCDLWASDLRRGAIAPETFDRRDAMLAFEGGRDVDGLGSDVVPAIVSEPLDGMWSSHCAGAALGTVSRVLIIT